MYCTITDTEMIFGNICKNLKMWCKFNVYFLAFTQITKSVRVLENKEVGCSKLGK